MAVFQTDGDPPRSGRSIRANIGCTRKSRAEPVKIVTAKSATMKKAKVTPEGHPALFFSHGISNFQSIYTGGKPRTSRARTLKSEFSDLCPTSDCPPVKMV